MATLNQLSDGAGDVSMNLLLNRDQKSASLFTLVPLKIGTGVTFSLHAELELDAEESELMRKYQFAKAPLVLSDPIDDLKKAFRPAMLLGIAAFIIVWFFASFTVTLTLSLLVIAAMTVVYFRALREQIVVSDLLGGGRTFWCDSIVELIQKEAYLEWISAYLRQVLESAKTWDDREIIPIRPLPKGDAKQSILNALHYGS